jgi:cell division protein ZapA (FtsZ GTPase activity inhibitor)
MAQKNSVTVRILDQNFVISTDASQERVSQIAEFVSQNLEQALSKSKGVSPYNAAILAALNIAEKYFDALEKRKAFQTEVSEKSKKILGLLDNANTSS